MSWIRRYAAERTKLTEVEVANAANDLKRPAAGVDEDGFSRVRIKPELANRHGAFLEPCLPDLDALAAAPRSMELFRARQFDRTLEVFYKTLGHTLKRVPEDERGPAAKSAIGAMRALVETIGPNDRLMPAMATLSSLLELRGRHAPGDLAENNVLALEAVSRFATEQEGRSGGHTALHLYRNLIEVLERRTRDLEAADRPALWREVAAFINRASPRSGIDQAYAAELNLSVLEALAQGATWRAALDAAEQRAIAARAGDVDGALERMPEPDPALSRAIAELIRRNPTDRSLLASAEHLMTELARQQGAIHEGNRPILEDMAAICRSIAESPAASKILDSFAAQIPQLLQAPPDVLAAARGGGGSLALLEAALIQRGQDRTPLAEVKQAFDGLSLVLAERSALALLPHLSNPEITVPLARALAERAKHAADQSELDRFAQKFAAAHPQLVASVPADAGQIASELSRGHGPSMPVHEIRKVGELAAAVKAELPALPVAALITQDGAGRPGLADLRKDLRHDPLPLLKALLPSIAALEGQAERDQVELVRRAIHLVRETAMIDRDIKAAFPRIEEDWKLGLAEPEKLTFAGKGAKLIALRAAKREGLDFLRMHDRLPPELAFTAGRHLSATQLGWLLSKIESFKSHGHSRIVRDLVLASIEAGRFDLLDAFTAAKVDRKVLTANAEFVAIEFRQGRLAQLPIDQIIEKLEKGEDASAAIAASRLDVDGIDSIKGTAAGRAELQRWKKELETLIKATPPEGKVYQDQGKNWRAPLMAVIKAIAEGKWPEWRATNEVGRRELDGLSREQIAIWMTDGVTGKPDPLQAERPEVLRAFTLLKGLKEALPVEVSLCGPGFEDLAWDPASLTRLGEEQSHLIAALHASNERGGEEHRRLSAQIGPLNRRLAVLELHQHLAQLLAEEPDPAEAILATKTLLERAESSVRHLGGRGSATVIAQIREVAQTLKSSPREGRHVVDESSLEGFFKAFTGGCLRVDNGSNKVSLIEHIAGVQYKIARAIDGGTVEGRGFARLYRFTFPGWTHKHGIQLDIIRGPSGSQNVDAGVKRMMHEHMLAKAEAMGLPYLTSDDTAVQLAEERGLRVLKNQKVTFHVDHGHTGLHHAQNIDFGTYWILWKHAHSYSSLTQEPDDSIEAARDYTKHVIVPRGVRLEDQP